MVDELETSFRACIAPLVANDASAGVTYQDEQRPSVEQAVNQFVEYVRKTEAYFQKQRATTAARCPELALQEEVDELEAELRRKDVVLQEHLNKLKQWQATLKAMQEYSGESSFSGTPSVQSLGAAMKWHRAGTTS